MSHPLVQFRCPADMVAAIEQAAEAAGLDRSGWLRAVVAAELERSAPRKGWRVADGTESPPEPSEAPSGPYRPASQRECVHPATYRRGRLCGACGLDLGQRLTMSHL